MNIMRDNSGLAMGNPMRIIDRLVSMGLISRNVLSSHSPPEQTVFLNLPEMVVADCVGPRPDEDYILEISNYFLDSIIASDYISITETDRPRRLEAP